MKRSKTSKSWMSEHVSDTYVKQAQIAGYRSRAAFKLIEANEKYQFLEKKMTGERCFIKKLRKHAKLN